MARLFINLDVDDIEAAVVVDDLEAALARARAAGATLEGEVSEHAYGRLALCADPFGHGFCLLELRGRGYDELIAPA
jgi:predicted enzyme related to lactoylglutathione lyase